MIKGEKVILRPVIESDLPTLEAWSNDFEVITEYNFFGLRPSGQAEKQFRETGMLTPQRGTLIITNHENVVLGDVSYRTITAAPVEGNYYFQIGIMLVPEQRGKGYGVEAQKLLADYLFSVYPIVRIEASTDVTNLPEQRALEKAGFTREGVLRQSQFRGGKWNDMVYYSKLRGEAL